MFLSSLEIKGFKSFADPAVLDLESGVTVVVGPNGSGKSNVVDAIGWVLGAQAPSAVRSQKMDDVIFAGSANRPALGRAEVTLTIDNGSGSLPVDFSEVTITRTLFRSGESEYAINGTSCRLLDIQELLSDSGVGRQQHVIISQGQIDAVLNAKPEDRRFIIEEAAGILKYRRRKEKSERRLASTEANLLRVQDLLREVRRQLRPLERQADAARRYDSVVGELRAIKLHLAGREIVRLRATLERAKVDQEALRTEERRHKDALATLDAEVIETEAALMSLGGTAAGDALVRYESLYERARGLASLLVERRRGIDRDRDAFVDQAVVASLEVEHAEAVAELAAVLEQAAGFEPLAADLDRRESAQRDARAADEERFARHRAEGSGAAAAVRGELAALGASIERAEEDSARAAERVTSSTTRRERVAVEEADARRELERLEAGAPELHASNERAERERVAAEERLGAADAAARTADAEAQRWSARHEALSQALDAARERAGAEHLADLDGVLGTLLDVVDVDEGYEMAFEAAVTDALSAVVVDGERAARAGIERLVAGDRTGSVLPPLRRASAPRSAPVGESLRAHVRATRDGVESVLDHLLAGVAVVDRGHDAAIEAALAHPESVFVTRGGDRFGPSGWRIAAASSGATGAALEEAQRAMGDCAEAARLASEKLDTASAAHVAALAAATEERDRVASHERAIADQRGRLERAADALAAVTEEIAGAERDAALVEERLGSLRGDRDRLSAQLVELEAQEQAAAAELADQRVVIETHRERARALGVERAELDRRIAAADERAQLLSSRVDAVELRLSRHVAEREAAHARRLEFDARASVTDQLSAFVAARTAEMESVLEELREHRRRESERTSEVTTVLDGLRARRAESERALQECRERAQRAEINDAETTLRLETATSSIRAELDADPDVAVATECPELADGVTPQARRRELERDLKQMGPINPLALEEFAALQERHEFLTEQLDDIRSTRRELGKVIAAVDQEIVSVFASAYADVSENFTALFDMLFPGGNGRISLTDPGDLLNTGIEIEARPSGKNVRKLSLLSGGERSLTALAYLFAVFRSRPSPFYVMDEVEAALDDVNLHRFLSLVAEFRSTAQLIIVSHQKRTMEAADVLYGVSMEAGGSSKVLSEKVGAGR